MGSLMLASITSLPRAEASLPLAFTDGVYDRLAALLAMIRLMLHRLAHPNRKRLPTP